MSKRNNHTDRGRERHHHFSRKMNTHFVLDSLGERDIALVMEFDNSILRFKAQPFSTLYIGIDGKRHRYTSDFLVQYTSYANSCFEVKPKKFTAALEFQYKFELLQAHFKKRYSIPLELRTEKSFTRERFINCRQLYRYRQKPITSDDNRLVKYVGRRSICFFELKDAASRIGSPIVSPFKLVAQKVCEMDMDNEILNDKSLLEILK